REMLEFSRFILDSITLLQGSSTGAGDLQEQASALQLAIQGKRDIQTIREASSSLRKGLLALMPNSALPERLLAESTTQDLYESHCASCHGRSGGGDGVLAAQLEPAPTNFTDADRASNRSLLGLYNAISHGIEQTAMPGFGQLSERERWSLAFHVGGIAFHNIDAAGDGAVGVTLQQLVNHSPAQLAAEQPGLKLREIAGLRANPDALFATAEHPLKTTRDQLSLAQAAYQQGDYPAAQALAVSAYLDGFELIENSLNARDIALRQAIEAGMMEMRQLLRRQQPPGVVEAAMKRTMAQLDEADLLLSGSMLSSATLFGASLVILLREGLEALLVVIALVTVLTRTGRKDGMRYVHVGWVSALVAGIATWAAAQSLISISGASREVMEGVAALLAAVVLLYVGIWMHSKTHAAQWQAYIQQHINTHLTAGTLWGLALLAFIAVYREVFETVLFYQTLLTQAGTHQYPAIAGGFGLAVSILAILAWVLVRYSVKLPVARFFSITTYLLLALAFILMGKAVSALQEAALISVTPLPVSFEMAWVGVKSTWQGLLAQLSVLLVFLAFLMTSRSKQNRSSATSPASDADNGGIQPLKPD
ncbi:MAG: cytochrome c/FTR1 family iron permease, partial [Haliea sp.]|uniref:cytochrome c/FTR1 family iron permease n=1 Tax=Haliea sp. TaxID=1932666 RepID=UPI0032F07718